MSEERCGLVRKSTIQTPVRRQRARSVDSAGKTRHTFEAWLRSQVPFGRVGNQVPCEWLSNHYYTWAGFG